jgi:hypothetical protein
MDCADFLSSLGFHNPLRHFRNEPVVLARSVHALLLSPPPTILAYERLLASEPVFDTSHSSNIARIRFLARIAALLLLPTTTT